MGRKAWLKLSLVSLLTGAAVAVIFFNQEKQGDAGNQAVEAINGTGSFENTDERLLQVEAELEVALRSGGIDPQKFKEVAEIINALEAQGASPERIDAARLILAQLGVGGEPQKTAVPAETKIQTPAPVKTQTQIQAKTPPQTTIQAPVLQTKTPAKGCVSNPNPVFTHHITDTSLIKYVAPPPTMGGSGTSLKTHSYIGTNGARVPVYAPVDMVLDTGAHYTIGPYWLGFTVSCEVRLRFAHITEPIQAIKDVFPPTPQDGSNNQAVRNKISFKAGDLIGYTTPGNWDFGVYNSTKPNRYAGDPTWGNSSVYTTGVCPFDYYSAEMRSDYADKFDSKILEGNPPHGESFCKGAETNP